MDALSTGHTGAKRVVRLFELFARDKVVTLGSDTFEVIGVVLEAATEYKGGWTGICGG